MQIKNLFMMSALTGLSLVGVAQAETPQDNRWYVAPFGTFI